MSFGKFFQHSTCFSQITNIVRTWLIILSRASQLFLHCLITIPRQYILYSQALSVTNCRFSEYLKLYFSEHRSWNNCKAPGPENYHSSLLLKWFAWLLQSEWTILWSYQEHKYNAGLLMTAVLKIGTPVL